MLADPVTDPVDLPIAPGAVVVIRDEEWLVRETEQTADGLPASRNPFTDYKRVIVSIDTLKSDRHVAACSSSAGMP